MMIKRFTAYLFMAVAMCMGSFAVNAAERIMYVTAQSFDLVGSLASQSVKHELTLAMWRTGSDSTDESLKSNLRASSNHFVMATAKPADDYQGFAPA